MLRSRSPGAGLPANSSSNLHARTAGLKFLLWTVSVHEPDVPTVIATSTFEVEQRRVVERQAADGANTPPLRPPG